MFAASRIVAVNFSHVGASTIKKESAVNVITYDLFRNNLPYPGGVYDAHLGTTDHSYKCQDCYQDKRSCPGHPGDLDLRYPLASPAAAPEARKWAKIICRRCGNCVVPDEAILKFPANKRLDEAAKLARQNIRECPHCRSKHPAIHKHAEEDMLLIADYIDGKLITHSVEILPHHLADIFSRISNNTVRKLGKPIESHPANFLTTCIRVPPTSIRPDVKKIGGGRSTNDYLTTMLQTIIKLNSLMPLIIPEAIDEKLKTAIFALQNAYYDLIKGTSDASSNSITQRLKGKQGRFRRNQLGKRVRNMCRSTIVGDVTLRPDQVGIPLVFARTIQREETVQKYNLARLQQCVNNGLKAYPGATKIERGNIEYGIESIQDLRLQIGDVVHRDYTDGDVVDYNRQPSLTISNISGMKARVYRDPRVRVEGMNVLICPLFNADFDGDQMNIAAVSKTPAVVEVQELSAIQNWTISHATGAPALGQCDDSVIGCFELTRSNVKFNRYHAMLIFNNTTWLPKFPPGNEFTGRDLISLIMQRTPINFKRNCEWYQPFLAQYVDYDPTEIRTVIRQGVHVEGVLDKRAIGKESAGGIYHIVANDYGNNTALDLMFNMQQMAIAYILQYGFTIGVNDLILTDAAKAKTVDVVADIINKSNLITQQLESGEIIPPIDKTITEYYEEQQINTLSLFDEFIEPILGSINHRTNNLFKIIACGDKGKFDNMFNMVSAVGQKLINGERMRMTFGFKRTLPYFTRFETSALSRGYILNSYLNGITMIEYIFNAMASRFDLISKALSTSVTGELNRKSIKNLESNITDNYRAVAKDTAVIAFAYGGDMIDPRKLERVSFPTVKMSNAELNALIITEHKADPMFREFYDEMIRDRDTYRHSYLRIENTNVKEILTEVRPMPVDVERVIKNALTEYPPEMTSSGPDEPLPEKLALVVEFIKTLDRALLRTDKMPPHVSQCTWLLKMLLRSHLHPRALQPLSRKIIGVILDKIIHRYKLALIAPGTAVGIMAAQAFCEPLTQYMLDAHHRSAAGGTSKSPMTKSKELFRAKTLDQLEMPTMMVRTTCTSAAEAQQLANNIEMMVFRQFVSTIQVFFERYGEPLHPLYSHEAAIIRTFNKFNPLITPPADLAHWCVRFAINRTTLILKNMSLELIIMKLRMKFPDVYFVYTPENAQDIIIRAYPRATLFKYIDTNEMRKLTTSLLDTTIRGVVGIKSAAVTKLIRHSVAADGSLVRDDSVFAITTNGCNIRGILRYRKIIPETLVTDAVQEIRRVFGIEAAKYRIPYEMFRIMERGNYRHSHIFAHEMTFTGNITSIENSGLKIREASNVLLRIGFSAPIQTIEEAAINGARDKVTGITAPLLIGDVPRHGTLYNKFYINNAFVAANTKTADDEISDL